MGKRFCKSLREAISAEWGREVVGKSVDFVECFTSTNIYCQR